MQAKRIFWFAVSIIVGLALGMAYGWLVHPIDYAEVPPERLRMDYQADYVLMVAEVYAGDQDIQEAANRLEVLGSQPVLRYIQQAILTATEVGYSPQDIELLAKLSEGIQSWILNPVGGSS